MDEDALQRRLNRLIESTTSARDMDAGGWWAGPQGSDAAGERRTMDDLKAGRLNWKAAHQYACQGIKLLNEGDRDAAEEYLWMATDLFIAALVTQLQRIRPSDRGGLDRQAKRRGRPRGSPNVKGRTK